MVPTPLGPSPPVRGDGSCFLGDGAGSFEAPFFPFFPASSNPSDPTGSREGVPGRESAPAGEDPEAFKRAHAAALSACLHDLAAELGGSFSAEHGVGKLKKGELARYKDPVSLDAMRAIKAALDPKGLMNPCKVQS